MFCEKSQGGQGTIQRKCAECEKEEALHRKPLHETGIPAVQRKSEARPAVDNHTEQTIQAASGSGAAMDERTQSFMSSRFGNSFSDVKIHTDATAVQLSRDLDAKAFTVGRDIYFNEGQYQPDAASGRHLLAHELTHVLQQNGDSGSIQRQTSGRPTEENVWGLNITRRMCGCRNNITDDINWANHAAASYAACDVPANTTGAQVETCFETANPTAVVVASTDSSGTMTLPAASSDPCQAISNKATFVHEIMHSRHTDAIARAQGSAFFREWTRLAGTPNRVNVLRATFPTEVANFERQWHDGHDWAQDEVHSYTWERRFLEDARNALNRICS